MEQLVLRLGPSPQASHAAWVVTRADGRARGAVQEGPLTQAASEARRRRILALIPGEEVLTTRVQLPTRNRRQLAQAVPYALEDEVAEDVEALHFAVGSPDADGRYPVLVIAREVLDRWLQVMRQAGIQPHVVAPDYLSLPRRDGAWSVLLEGDRALVRTGAAQGLACDREHLVLFLDEGSEDRRVRLWGCGDEDASALGLSAEIEQQACPEHPLLLLADQAPHQPVNLLQGPYSQRQAYDRAMRPWYVPAALAGLWLVVHLSALASDVYQLRQERAELKATVTSIFREAFPEVQRVVDPRVQARQRLERLRAGQQDSDGTPALRLLAAAAPHLAGDNGMQVQRLTYRAGRLQLELTATDLQRLDGLRQRLHEQAGLTATLESAETGADGIRGRLRLEVNPS